MDVPAVDLAARPAAAPGARAADTAALRRAAEALEAGFLAEMLKAAGVGAPRDGFGGGIGEEQFASFLTEAHADAIMRSGGIGLAESLFHALKDRSHADG